MFSTVLLSNLESILTYDMNRELQEKSTVKKLKNGRKVNKNISFNTIKNRLIDLLLSDIPIPETLKQIQDIFGMNPTQIRS